MNSNNNLLNKQQNNLENFNGVYLLISENEKKYYRNKCYIGYTVNPNRRIKQHNLGTKCGGARKTDQKGPWIMALIIHGFPTRKIALMFEFAWQQPTISRRLRYLNNIKKTKSESHLKYNFRILCEMLNVGPWKFFPLTIRWLCKDYQLDFPITKQPPAHMKICYNKLEIVKKVKTSLINEETELFIENCFICFKTINNEKEKKVTCMNKNCNIIFHLICLSVLCNKANEFLPVNACCPLCQSKYLWGELILYNSNYENKNNYELVEAEYDDKKIIIDLSDDDNSDT